MKTIILILLTVAVSVQVIAQQATGLFEQLTEKYADNDGFSASRITSDMFDLYLKKNNIEKESPVSKALNNLESILVIAQSKYLLGVVAASGVNKNDVEEQRSLLHKTILDHYKSQNYTLFKTEKRLGEDVKVYLKKNQEKIVSLALVTNSASSTNLVELKGDIDLKIVSELSRVLNLRGLENLYKIDNSGSAYGRALGLTSGYAPFDVEEMVMRQREFAEQFKLSDEQRKNIEQQAKQMAEQQAQMAEKYREMADKYRRFPIFLSQPGDTNTVYYLNGKKVKANKIKELEQGTIENIEVNKPKKDGDKTIIRLRTK